MANIKTLVYGIIAFCLIIGCGVGMIASMNINSYVKNPEELNYFNASFNKIASINGNLSGMNSGLKNSGSETTEEQGSLNSLVFTGWQRLKGIDQTIGAAPEIITATGESFGIPGFVITLLICGIIALVVFTILSAIFMREI